MSHDACTAQPISWLELELRALGELGTERAGRIDDHLAGCPVCRACMERIAGDARELPRLVVPPARRFWNRWRLAWSVTGAALVAALVLLLIWPRGSQPAGLPPARLQVKGGGELLLELVRDRAGVVTHQPTGFRDGDQFQVMVTCQDAGELEAALVVFDRGEAHFPAPPQAIGCGNRVVFPAAFRLTGRPEQPVTVCLALERLEPGRIRSPADLPRGRTACIRLDPE
jgi:hypothetical protein